ncbi:ABC transporter substrate-binding protein [Rhodoferax sp.]|uniref:ABC transporter substrate-binding protein n=1 Tax=Rhodoferax sp. TaxID=50421 RepID=UPI00374DBBFB
MINRRRFSVATGVVAVSGFPSVHAQSGGKIVLGQSAALTGPASQLGIQFSQGARLYFDQVNAQGGVSGRQIELRTMDDGYEPDRCQENTRKLLSGDALALFGYVGTPTSAVALPLATQAKIPFVAPCTGAMVLREPFNKWAFHVRASYQDETALIVKQLTQLGLERIAVFYQNDGYGKAGLDGVNLALSKLGHKPVALATVERNSVDVAAAVQTLRAAQPQAIVQISAYKSCAAFIRAARKAGYGGQFFNVSFVGTQALADELGKDAAGIVVSQVMPSPYSMTTAISREFAAAVKTAGGESRANFSSIEGYLSAKVLVEGMKRAATKGLTPESLVTGLESIGTQSFGGFAVAFSGTDHVASSFVDLSMLTGDGRVRT